MKNKLIFNWLNIQAAVFTIAWLLTFALYLPAAKAGFVADFSGWLDQVRNQSFLDFVNRTHFSGQSLYQFTQFCTWVFYKILGVHQLLWHLLFVTLHALNCMLLYRLASRLMQFCGIQKGNSIAMGSVLLYCISPYISEVIVWEPSYHFLQGFLLILVVLNAAFDYIIDCKPKHIFIAGGIYLLSTFSLEIFYTTPFLLLTLGIWAQYCGAPDNRHFRIIFRYFFLPAISLFALHLILFRIVYGGWIAHIGKGAVTGVNLTTFGKPLKYFFHLGLLGRFWPLKIKTAVYAFCDNPFVVLIFLVFIAASLIYIVSKIGKMSPKARFASLIYIWLLLFLAVLIPLWFGEILYVLYDRYLYFAAPIFYLLLAVAISCIPIKFVKIFFVAAFSVLSLRFTVLVSRYWGKSAKVIDGLMQSVPTQTGKKILLLNLPQCLNGVAMIGAENNSEFRLLHEMLYPDKPVRDSVYDCLAFNMNTPDDGAHVRVLDDSTVLVTLNQLGSWWWRAGFGAEDFENSEFAIKLIHTGAAGIFYRINLDDQTTKFDFINEKIRMAVTPARPDTSVWRLKYIDSLPHRKIRVRDFHLGLPDLSNSKTILHLELAYPVDFSKIGPPKGSLTRISGNGSGFSYVLRLKKPASGYLLLFEEGDHWKLVDMINKSWDQY